MDIIRGTTPTIIVTVQTKEVDLSEVMSIWAYISQQNKVKIDKELCDVTIDTEHKTITLTLSQEDTLALRAGYDTIFQIRLLLEDGTALATPGAKVVVKEVYKGGVIQ